MITLSGFYCSSSCCKAAVVNVSVVVNVADTLFATFLILQILQLQLLTQTMLIMSML